MLVLVYRKCSTCQKALKWLDENKVEYTERAIVDENPTFEEFNKRTLVDQPFQWDNRMLFMPMNT